MKPPATSPPGLSKDESVSAWKTAQKYGCDMSLIEENLRLTPAARIRAHRRALKTIRLLQKGMERRRGRA